MTDAAPIWDETVPLMGTFPVHWSVTMDEKGDVIVWVSPHQVIPDAERAEGEERTGTITSLYSPLVCHDDTHIVAAAQIMSRVAIEEWIKPYLTSRLAIAMREQRERQGGYDATRSPYAEDAPPEPEDG